MGTFHIICIDFQHRLRIHPRLLGGTKVLVSHLRGCLLSILCHIDHTSESTHSLIIQYIFIQFMTRTMRDMMGNQRIIIDMLLFVGYHATITETLGTLAIELEVELITCHSVMQRDDVVIDTAVCLLVDIYITDPNILSMSLFQTIEVELGVLSHKASMT